MRKKILFIFIGLFLGFLIWNYKMILYGISQGIGQFEVIWNAQPIEDLLKDDLTPDSTKQKLKYTKIVREFAIQELGLHHSDNYTTYYDQKGKTILWNLSASEKYQLVPYQWDYPFLGSMPYKGFFDLKKAIKEQKILVGEGYDTRIRTVDGWSTLGILKDPILSNMLNRSPGQLAEVIIHELVHATIFVKNEIEFNENLASFIGEEGAILFLKKHFGDSSAELLQYENEEHDSKIFIRYILKSTKRLDSLYQSFTDEPKSLKDSLKSNLIHSITGGVDHLDFYEDKYQHLFDEALPNNAYFMSFIRYHSRESDLQKMYKKYHYNLVEMIEALKKTYEQ